MRHLLTVLHLVRPLNSSVFHSCFRARVTTFLLLAMVWGCNAQHPQGQAVQDEGAVKIGTQDVVRDSFPKGKRIELLPEGYGERDTYSYLFAFYDSTGKMVKKLTDRQLPVYSKYNALDFPRMKERYGEPVKEGGVGVPIYYNLRGTPYSERKKVLQKAGVTGVPDSIIRRSTEITYFGRGVRLGYYDQASNATNFIVSLATVLFFDRDAKYPIYTELYQTHVDVYDASGEAVHQIDINHCVDQASISNDGGYLLLINATPHMYDGSTFDLPFLMFDLKENKTDTINMKNNGIVDFVPIYMIYADSYFQILLSAGPNVGHLLINPCEKIMHIKNYPDKGFRSPDRGYDFKSMQLPSGYKINLMEYETITY